MSKSKIIPFLLFFSVAALIGAYTAQYVFDFQPCILCLYQRIPFAAIIVICSATLIFKNIKIHNLAIFFCALLLLINAGIASYQVGVEKKIFKGPDTCSAKNLEDIANLEELKAAIFKTKAVRCDEPEFFFLTLSMASWNAIYCSSLLILILLLRRRRA
jgi:disulfide bond formation protein DsbB